MYQSMLDRFIYSTHKTMDEANAALEDCFATGEIVEAERPLIERKLFHGRVRFCITLPAS